MRLDLSDDPNEPATPLSLGYRVGRHALLALPDEMRANGTHHVTLNLSSERPVREVIEELADDVLPAFHD
jgi:hypothetical protein